MHVALGVTCPALFASLVPYLHEGDHRTHAGVHHPGLMTAGCCCADKRKELTLHTYEPAARVMQESRGGQQVEQWLSSWKEPSLLVLHKGFEGHLPFLP